jgi:stage II sporulation protein D
MGAQGRDAGAILAQYFPAADAADEESGLQWQRVRGSGFVLETLDAGDGRLAGKLSEALGDAERRSGLQAAGPITVRAFRSTEAFREETLAPGWVAAFTEGAWIGAQPLRTLEARGLLAGVMRHEFLHALVEGQAGAGAPLWLREGLVEVWGDGGVGARPAMKIDEVDGRLARAGTERESEEAHRAAGWYAQKLMDRYGRRRWMRCGEGFGGFPPMNQSAIHGWGTRHRVVVYSCRDAADAFDCDDCYE